MKRVWVCTLAVCLLALGCLPGAAVAQREGATRQCSEYSDSFDSFNLEHWQDASFLSEEVSGEIAVENGRLTLKSPENEATDLHVFSVFALDGDFDLQTDYQVSESLAVTGCRFNAGIVLENLELSYKCYLAVKPGKELFYRARLDRFGEANVEIQKVSEAANQGIIRVKRVAGHLTCSAMIDGEWRELYSFKQPCTDKLRVRFKLQTTADALEGKALHCPVTASFDNFTIHSCGAIYSE